jgi:3-deoxy-7-phosphoheptulonate synthase
LLPTPRSATLVGMDRQWTPSRWRDLPAEQQPEWPDQHILDQTLKSLSALPPLVFAGEARSLQRALAEVAAGEAFLLQAGDCAESFHDFTADSIRDKLKVILQMAIVLTYGAGVPVVKLGRIAGQFAKPRSSGTEIVDGVALPSFRGHVVNDDSPTLSARIPDPTRMLTAYHQSASTLNLLRAFTKGGFADLSHVHTWNQQFVAGSPGGQHYDALAAEIDRALRFMRACGINLGDEASLQQVDFYTSHEGLILSYEEAMTRRDSLTGDWYDTSAHLVWVGERTRRVDGAHVDFLSGLSNPVAAKIGPGASPAEVVALCAALDPDRTPGRLTLITRLGAGRAPDLLPALLAAVRRAGHPVVWTCDPMHGNTFTGQGGRKTRHFDHVLTEIREFFAVCRSEGAWPGGVHVELTGDNVTECLGGTDEVLENQLELRYTTTCDPRLNASQSLDLAFQVADLLRS